METSYFISLINCCCCIQRNKLQTNLHIFFLSIIVDCQPSCTDSITIFYDCAPILNSFCALFVLYTAIFICDFFSTRFSRLRCNKIYRVHYIFSRYCTRCYSVDGFYAINNIEFWRSLRLELFPELIRYNFTHSIWPNSVIFFAYFHRQFMENLIVYIKSICVFHLIQALMKLLFRKFKFEQSFSIDNCCKSL